MDVASINIRHCRVDENGRFKEYISSGLDNCLNLEANIDQTGRAFKQDIVESMFDEGVVAIDVYKRQRQYIHKQYNPAIILNSVLKSILFGSPVP